MGLESDERQEHVLALVEQARSGDAHSLNLLLEYQYHSIQRRIARLVRDPHQVEDLTQDVCVHIAKSISHLEDSRAFSAWVSKIVERTVYREWKRRDVVVQPLEENHQLGLGDELFSHQIVEWLFIESLVASLPSTLPAVIVLQSQGCVQCDDPGAPFDSCGMMQTDHLNPALSNPIDLGRQF